ncbi:MAG: glucose/galactose MFS transporter, partial [Flavobacteriales bacterium]|nr:glucose/galactose MFS transporter [Flavobacteriales bacterium]
KVLSVFGFGAILLILISISTSGLTAMFSILAVGLFNSIMFPTIFTLSIDQLGEYKAEGSGLLCTAIVGGAVIPALTGLLIDFKGFSLAFGVLTLFYFVIVLFGRKALKTLTN